MKTFENYYLYDYVIMAYRELINKIDEDMEEKLINNLYYLIDEFTNEEIHKYVNENYII